MAKNKEQYLDKAGAKHLTDKLREEIANSGGGIINETDPTVPAWAKEAEKPSYTATEVGADASGTAETKVSAHNASAAAHNDIRLLVQGLTDRLNALANSDDTTLDQMAEVVAYIKSNRDLIEGITSAKVSVSDIINNLTTNVANKPLSAAQGVALKALIDAITVPTKLSELSGDSTHRVVTDAEKTAWNSKIPTSEKGAANGVASLGSDGKVPSAQLPSLPSVDSSLSDTSTNAVQNKVVKAALDEIKNDPAYFITTYTDNGDGTATADHTFDEQLAALMAGKILFATVDGLIFHLLSVDDGIAYIFVAADSTSLMSGIIYHYNNDTVEIISANAQIPAKISDLDNDSGYQTSSQVNATISSKLISYVPKAGDTEMSGVKTFKGITRLQNGAAAGGLIIGADVSASTLTANTRKLGRIVIPTCEDVAKKCVILSADMTVAESGNADETGNLVEFGGRLGDSTNTSPDKLAFVVATTHNGTGSANKKRVLMLTPTGANFAVQPTYNDAKLATESFVTGKGYQTEAQVTTLINNALGVIENGSY